MTILQRELAGGSLADTGGKVPEANLVLFTSRTSPHPFILHPDASGTPAGLPSIIMTVVPKHSAGEQAAVLERTLPCSETGTICLLSLTHTSAIKFFHVFYRLMSPSS